MHLFRPYRVWTDEPTPPALCLGTSEYGDKSLGYKDNNPFSQLYPFCLWHAMQEWHKQLAIYIKQRSTERLKKHAQETCKWILKLD